MFFLEAYRHDVRYYRQFHPTQTHILPNGYTRISADEQRLTFQVDALREAGCNKVLTKEVSGARTDRLGLVEAVEYLREDATLVIWRLGRMGCSQRDLVQRVADL